MITAFRLKLIPLVVSVCLFTTLLATAQLSKSSPPKTDAEKIADALRAGPKFIPSGATILDWPSPSGGEYRVLRKGSNEWTCLPGIPGYSHDEPGCFDPVFLQWMKDSVAGKDPHITSVGISYMYAGAWVPNLSGPGPKTQDFQVGPHIMIPFGPQWRYPFSAVPSTVSRPGVRARSPRPGASVEPDWHRDSLSDIP
jgi:hypothetical protein